MAPPAVGPPGSEPPPAVRPPGQWAPPAVGLSSRSPTLGRRGASLCSLGALWSVLVLLDGGVMAFLGLLPQLLFKTQRPTRRVHSQ